MDQTEDATLTLISCYPYRKDNKRIVVTAVFRYQFLNLDYNCPEEISHGKQKTETLSK